MEKRGSKLIKKLIEKISLSDTYINKTMVDTRVREAQRVTVIGFFVNLLLSVGKIGAGIVGKSSAMLADGIHSLSDFVTDVIVIVFIRLSAKKSDDDHTYGHGKYETFATLIISIVLLGVGIGMCWDSGHKIYLAIKGEVLPTPHLIALWAALISIVSKEVLFRYTRHVGMTIGSSVVIANGWHHRSDALSSIGAAIGISGAIILGDKWVILDPIAGFIVSLFIVKVAWQLGKPCIDELLEHALPQDLCNKIKLAIESNDRVLSYNELKTRKVGNAIAVDVHIQLNKELTFVEAHNITTEVEELIKDALGGDAFVNIHTEPV